MSKRQNYTYLKDMSITNPVWGLGPSPRPASTPSLSPDELSGPTSMLNTRVEEKNGTKGVAVVVVPVKRTLRNGTEVTDLSQFNREPKFSQMMQPGTLVASEPTHFPSVTPVDPATRQRIPNSTAKKQKSPLTP